MAPAWAAVAWAAVAWVAVAWVASAPPATTSPRPAPANRRRLLLLPLNSDAHAFPFVYNMLRPIGKGCASFA